MTVVTAESQDKLACLSPIFEFWERGDGGAAIESNNRSISQVGEGEESRLISIVFSVTTLCPHPPVRDISNAHRDVTPPSKLRTEYRPTESLLSLIYHISHGDVLRGGGRDHQASPQ